MAGKVTDLAMETDVRQLKTIGNPKILGDAIPAIQTGLNLADVIVPQARVQRVQSRNVTGHNTLALDFLHGISIGGEFVIIGELAFLIASLQSGSVVGGCI